MVIKLPKLIQILYLQLFVVLKKKLGNQQTKTFNTELRLPGTISCTSRMSNSVELKPLTARKYIVKVHAHTTLILPSLSHVLIHTNTYSDSALADHVHHLGQMTTLGQSINCCLGEL